MKKKALIAAALVLAVSLAWCFQKRLFQDDEKRIREIVNEMAGAAERQDPDGLIRYFSSDYKDKNGYTKFVIAQLVRSNIGSVDELRVTIKDLDVLVAGDQAYATVTLVTEAKKNKKLYYPFGSDQDPESPRLTFARTGRGDWEIIKVENVNRSGF